MPTYTYECKKCGHTQDVFHAISASPRVKCEECRGVCRKLLGTGAGLIFKGSGFYETDYKRGGNGKGKGEGAKSDKATSESGTSDSSSKSESSKSDSGKSSTKSESTSGGSKGKSSKD